jgi:hypothetical protein
MQETTVPLPNETHGGEDVGIWARGPGSDAIRGSVEQNAIFHFAAQAAPHLRAALCAKGLCDANGVPVALPWSRIQAALRRKGARVEFPDRISRASESLDRKFTLKARRSFSLTPDTGRCTPQNGFASTR